jgi:hypothetical protein
MAEVDTSSYPKPQAQKSLIDQVQGFQSLESNRLTIDKQKLDLMKQRFQELNTQLVGLYNKPDLSQDDLVQAAQRNVKLGFMPADQAASFISTIPPTQGMTPQQQAATLKGFVGNTIQHVRTVDQAIDFHYGRQGTQTDNQNTFSGTIANPAQGGGFTPATKTPIQLPPTTESVDNNPTLPNGQPNPNYLSKGLLGSTGPSGPQPVAPVTPVPAPRPANAPFFQGEGRVEPQAAPQTAPPSLKSITAGAIGPTRERIDLEGTTPAKNFDDRFGASFPNRVVTAPPPGVASAIETVGGQSGKDYAAALGRARNFQADLYPAQAALHALKELGPQAVGPGTETFNDLKRAIVTWLPNVDPKIINDVSNFDQVKKYLVNVARTSGNTGTNDQLAASFEGNPNVKMSTAGVDTVLKSIIALRRMENAQTLLFNEQGLSPDKFSQWVSKNQNVFDPRAFGFVDMDRKAQDKLVKSLSKKELQKFEYSLLFAEKAGMIAPPQLKQ